MRIFGSIAYLHIPKEIVRGKFESRSKKCHMIGYCPNGYRLWCPEDEKLLLGRDVVFDEFKFDFEDENFYNRSLPSQTETKDALKLHNQGGKAKISENNDDTGAQGDVLTDDEFDETSVAESEETTQQKEERNVEGTRRSSRVSNKPKHLEEYYCAIALSAELPRRNSRKYRRNRESRR